jgi:phospholipase/carboxylesterase
MSPNDDLLIQRAGSRSTVPRLLLLFHGVGSSAEDLRPLGQALAAQLPQAWVVNVRSPDPSDLGQGWQWFSVRDVTEANRQSRVAAAMPRFQGAVSAWQRESEAASQDTVLIGFSQGAIMALESTQQPQPLAARVVAIAGRFAQTPRSAPSDVALHLMHGDQDRVMPLALGEDATRQWRALGGEATLDRFSGLGHGIDARVVRRVAEYLGKPER